MKEKRSPERQIRYLERRRQQGLVKTSVLIPDGMHHVIQDHARRLREEFLKTSADKAD